MFPVRSWLWLHWLSSRWLRHSIFVASGRAFWTPQAFKNLCLLVLCKSLGELSVSIGAFRPVIRVWWLCLARTLRCTWICSGSWGASVDGPCARGTMDRSWCSCLSITYLKSHIVSRSDTLFCEVCCTFCVGRSSEPCDTTNMFSW